MAVRMLKSDAVKRWPKDVTADDFKVTYEGAVLATGERNGYHDSDFYATVWDEEEQKIKTVEYGTTRFWTYGNSATPDATAEVIAKAQAALAESYLAMAKYDDEAKAKTVEKGKTVKLTRSYTNRKLGRTFEAGSTGQVFWVGKDQYRRFGLRAGVRIDGEGVFLDDDRLEVVGWEQYLTPEGQLRRVCEGNARYKARQWGIVCGVEEGELEATITIIADGGGRLEAVA